MNFEDIKKSRKISNIPYTFLAIPTTFPNFLQSSHDYYYSLKQVGHLEAVPLDTHTPHSMPQTLLISQSLVPPLHSLKENDRSSLQLTL